jgi:hypothetical protein
MTYTPSTLFNLIIKKKAGDKAKYLNLEALYDDFESVLIESVDKINEIKSDPIYPLNLITQGKDDKFDIYFILTYYTTLYLKLFDILNNITFEGVRVSYRCRCSLINYGAIDVNCKFCCQIAFFASKIYLGLFKEDIENYCKENNIYLLHKEAECNEQRNYYAKCVRCNYQSSFQKKFLCRCIPSIKMLLVASLPEGAPLEFSEMFADPNHYCIS